MNFAAWSWAEKIVSTNDQFVFVPQFIQCAAECRAAGHKAGPFLAQAEIHAVRIDSSLAAARQIGKKSAALQNELDKCFIN